MTSEIKETLERLAHLEATAAAARATGDEAAANDYFRNALNLALSAANVTSSAESISDRPEILHIAARLALHCGEVAQAREFVDEAIQIDVTISPPDRWVELLDMSAWPDAWLIAAVRRDPPDMTALDTLVNRTWKTLFGRCRLLTMDHDKASDLAQQAWARVLRARRDLKPGGNFLAYVTTVATNLWRDAHRATRRAGPLAEHRLASLDEPQSNDADTTIVLADVIPDATSLQTRERRLLMMDIDCALEQMPPLLREVLVSRFVADESCASIGARHGRTEQSASGWVREAIREMKRLLEEPERVTADADRTERNCKPSRPVGQAAE